MEAAQEAFARSLEHLSVLRNETNFLSWVSVIALNYGRTKIRLDQMRYNELPAPDIMEQGWDAFDPEYGDIEDVNFIRRWILTLPEADQQLILLKFYYSLSNQVISEQAERPLGSVKRRLFHLKQKLRDALTQASHGESLTPLRVQQ
jgi:RNA polymerase sigma factor (sigma-70 family)